LANTVIRRLIAGLIVVGLAFGIWVLWPRHDSDPLPTTLPQAAVTSTTSTSSTATTAEAPTTTSTTSPESHVVETVDEAEAILRDLWFGWFEGIYNQDEDRIKEVVGTQALLDNARSQFGVMVFLDQPMRDGLRFDQVEILRADDECTALWSTSTSAFLDMDGPRTGVDVFRFADNSWILVSSWTLSGDLWERDCEASLEPF
jgi:hypothetical protein